MNKFTLAVTLLVSLILTSCSGKSSVSQPPPESDTAVQGTVAVHIDRQQTFQRIDGFGFFGARSVWWESDQSKLFSTAWADDVINDLGLTIWRNEYYPPSTPAQSQDADWQKQLPVVKGLAQAAADAEVPLKFIFTVWSPPAEFKCALDGDNQPLPGTPHTGGTKQGGTLDPDKYTAFGNWLADGIQLYKDEGIDVYAISPQNEPLFKQDFNSCYYNPSEWYGDMLKNSMPVVKSRFPGVKIFGSENMLEMEGGADRQWFYGKGLKDDPAALDQLDIWAVHGYQEGITPTAGSKLKQLWNTFRSELMEPSSKPGWMTETSGYSDEWTPTGDKAGALDLALDIQSALVNGHVSAWVWWQGSEGSITDYSLMSPSKKGKKYYASKHFYRFIRPGAKMVSVSTTLDSGVSASAFQHDGMGSFTVVLINSSDKNLQADLSGESLPTEFDYYVTGSSSTENCVKREGKVSSGAIFLPRFSVVTLVSGNVFE